jgi:hypothetical protein
VIQTSVPELNEVLPFGCFPEVGLSLITGPTRAGKTSLLIDIARMALADSQQKVLVFAEVPEVWTRAALSGAILGTLLLQRHRSTRIPEEDAVDVTGVTLILVDGHRLSGFMQEVARTKPVIYATRRATSSGLVNLSTAAFELSCVGKDRRQLKLTKSREAMPGLAAVFKLDADHRPVSPDYKNPAPPSRWEVLLRDDDL